MTPSQLLSRVRAKKPAAPPVTTEAAEPPADDEGLDPAFVKQREAAAEEARVEAEAAAAGKYVTRSEYEAGLLALGLALKELADGSRDAFFSSDRYTQHLQKTAEASSPSVKRALQRLLQAITGHRSRGYGIDRGRQRTPGQPWDR
jgi:hypothetical protein